MPPVNVDRILIVSVLRLSHYVPEYGLKKRKEKSVEENLKS